MEFGSTNYTGMELYEFVGCEPGKAYLGSVTALAAGVPYIFVATGTELAVYSDGTTAATPGNHNGLHGTFDNDTEVAADNYIVYNNALCEAETTCYVNANRAYVVMSEVPTTHTQMPGRRYIGMSTKGENAATGLDNIATSENAVKVINNGQLIIIRGGEKFTLTLTDSNGQPVEATWEADLPGTVTIDGNVITGKTKGTTIVSFRVYNWVYECIVRVSSTVKDDSAVG